MSDAELAIRVSSIDDLFLPFDAGPLAARRLNDEARYHLLDCWESVRPAEHPVLVVYAPEHERGRTDEQAVQAAVRADMQINTRSLNRAYPLNRHDTLALWAGVAIFLFTVVLSTTLDEESHAVLIAGISQAVVVIGWVALWDPAKRLFGERIPHRLTRRRYAELAEIEVRFRWT
jgi:hypothetical protein